MLIRCSEITHQPLRSGPLLITHEWPYKWVTGVITPVRAHFVAEEL